VHLCSDPQDKLDAITYHYQCRNNRGRWVGTVKPAYSAYVCEGVTLHHTDIANGVTVAAATEAVMHSRPSGGGVCARPREGQVRKHRCRGTNNTQLTEGYR